jgi:exopolyphosphatase/guanosine-5'-triphosphate,3'-diphosphate pyrophosphatase
MRLAAIDLGTVTARLLIAEVEAVGQDNAVGEGSAGRPNSSLALGCEELPSSLSGNRICELERHMRITHLGEDLQRTGAIGEAAIAREIAALQDFKAAIRAVEKCDGRSVERICAVATSAMRDAQNSDEVLDALHDASGIKVEVIAGKREAQLSFFGALSGFAEDEALRDAAVLTVDIGGGSTELILGTTEGNSGPRVLAAHSFDVGSRRVSDRFLGSDPPTPKELSRAQAWVWAEMGSYFKGLSSRPQVLIAVAGTATTAVSVRDAMTQYDPRKVHGVRVSSGELEKVLNELAILKLEQRRHCTGLEPGRAPVIVGGLVILQAVMQLANLTSFIASETDILQGILLDATIGIRSGRGSLLGDQAPLRRIYR